jgi:hypothetical protein
MPLTFSHPAAVIPLLGPLRRFSAPSALVFGSMMPDLTYFVPGLPGGAMTHSPPGLFFFCLPAGMIIYLLFHVLMKHPLIALLPPAFERRLVPHEVSRLEMTPRMLLMVAASLVIGAFTHFCWDSFTHEWGWPVRHWEWLSRIVLTFHGTPIRWYRVLQYISSVFGLLVIAWWLWGWQRRAPIHVMPTDVNLRGVRSGFIAVMLLLSIGTAWVKVASYDLHDLSGLQTQFLIFKAITVSASTFSACMLTYCVLWQLGLFHRQRAA